MAIINDDGTVKKQGSWEQDITFSKTNIDNLRKANAIKLELIFDNKGVKPSLFAYYNKFKISIKMAMRIDVDMQTDSIVKAK
jgi:hypothetical protein